MSGILKHFKRRKFATGGDAHDIRLNDPVGMSDPRTQIPQTASLAGPTTPGTGREYHPLANADYYTYGQAGPEHQFFTGSLPVAPLKPNNLPTGGGDGSTPGGGGAKGVLSDIVDLAGTAKTAGQLANMAGIDNEYTQAMQNPIQAAKDYFGNSGMNQVGSGQYANDALSDAGYGSNWTTPVLGGLGAAGAASSLGGAGTIASITPEMIGAGEGAIAATTGASAASGAGAAGATGSGVAGAGGGAGASGLGALAAPAAIAAIGWAAADAFNKSGDIKSGATSALLKNMTDSQGWKLVNPKNGTYQMPDGRWVRADEHARAVSEALRKGDTAGAQRAYEEWMASAKTPGGHARGGSLETGDPGVLHYATDPKFNGTVRGAGTGRSDEIPARLSDGEYVMDAETVAMLGDGSTDAGAKKLDEMRARLRAHKGKKLAKGKFSDNAKDPMEYVK